MYDGDQWCIDTVYRLRSQCDNAGDHFPRSSFSALQVCSIFFLSGAIGLGEYWAQGNGRTNAVDGMDGG